MSERRQEVKIAARTPGAAWDVTHVHFLESDRVWPEAEIEPHDVDGVPCPAVVRTLAYRVADWMPDGSVIRTHPVVFACSCATEEDDVWPTLIADARMMWSAQQFLGSLASLRLD